jgi:hypothetical protein
MTEVFEVGVFAVALADVFHRDHGEIKYGLKFREIDTVFPEVLPESRSALS